MRSENTKALANRLKNAGATPRGFRTTMTRLHARARKATTSDDVRRIDAAAFKAYEKGRAELSWPYDKDLLDQMNEEIHEAKKTAQAAVERFEEERRAARDEEIKRLRAEERRLARMDWQNL